MQDWINHLNPADRLWFNNFGAERWEEYRNAESEEAFKTALQQRIGVELEKERYVNHLSPWSLRTFKDLGGKQWDGYINATSLYDFRRLLDKHDEVRSLHPETKKLFDDLGGFEWEGFKEATNGHELSRRLAFIYKEKDWPNWIDRLNAKQRQMFESLGGTDWEGFKASPWEDTLRAMLDQAIKEAESPSWIEHLNETERSWFERLGGYNWEGFEESETEDEFLEVLHEVIEETESAMQTIAEEYPLACEQMVKLAHYGLSDVQVEYAMKAIKMQAFQENMDGKDLLYVFQEKSVDEKEHKSGRSHNFYVMTRNDFLKRYDISELTYTDFAASGNEVYGVYETPWLDDAREFALDRLAIGEMTKEDFANFRAQQNVFAIKSVRANFPEQAFICTQTREILFGDYLTIHDVIYEPDHCYPGGLITTGNDGSIFEDGKQRTIPLDLIPDVDAQIAKFTSAIEKANPEKEIRFHRDFDEECAYQVASEYDYDTDEERFVDRFCFGKIRSHDGNLFVLT